jgi:cystathionine beta-synthase
VDPVGSVLHDFYYTGNMPEAHTYKVEGIGEDFIPSTTDFSYVDAVVQVTDGESFRMARRLVREEGLFVGGSAGSAVAGALKYARDRALTSDDVIVVLLPDSGSRYLSKFLDDEWMREHGFSPFEEIRGQVAELLAARGPAPVITVPPSMSTGDVVELMKANDISQVPVVGDGGDLLGVVSDRDVLGRLIEPGSHPADAIAPMVSNRIAVVEPTTTLAVLGQIFADGDVAVVRDNGQLSAVLTKIDLIDHLAGRKRV